MNDESTGHARTLAVALLAVTGGFVLLASPAAGQGHGAACIEMLENRTGANATDANRTVSAPGGRLAAAIGNQREEIGSALNDSARNDRWFDDRLANATTARERAGIVADEAERIESNVTTLEGCWASNRSEPVSGERAVDLDPGQRDALANLTRSLHRRLNETRAEADGLPAPLREEYGVDEASLAALERRVVALRNHTARPETPGPTDGTTVPIRPPR